MKAYIIDQELFDQALDDTVAQIEAELKRRPSAKNVAGDPLYDYARSCRFHIFRLKDRIKALP